MFIGIIVFSIIGIIVLAAFLAITYIHYYVLVLLVALGICYIVGSIAKSDAKQVCPLKGSNYDKYF